jgi:hypothetical protein
VSSEFYGVLVDYDGDLRGVWWEIAMMNKEIGGCHCLLVENRQVLGKFLSQSSLWISFKLF